MSVKRETSTTIGTASGMIYQRWNLSRQAFKRRVDTHDVDHRGAKKSLEMERIEYNDMVEALATY